MNDLDSSAYHVYVIIVVMYDFVSAFKEGLLSVDSISYAGEKILSHICWSLVQFVTNLELTHS